MVWRDITIHAPQDFSDFLRFIFTSRSDSDVKKEEYKALVMRGYFADPDTIRRMLQRARIAVGAARPDIAISQEQLLQDFLSMLPTEHCTKVYESPEYTATGGAGITIDVAARVAQNYHRAIMRTTTTGARQRPAARLATMQQLLPGNQEPNNEPDMLARLETAIQGEDMVGQDGYESDSPSEAPSLVSASSESGDEEAEEREAFIYTSELTLKDTGASLEFIPKKLITNVKDLENLDDFRDLENLPVDDTDDEMDEDMPPPLVDDYSDSESDTDTDEEVEAAAAEPPRKAKISYEDALKVAAKKNKEHWNTYYRGRQRRPLKRPPPQRLNRNRLVQFRGTVASAPCSILVDSGASRDFISQEKVEKLQLQTTAVDTPFGVSMADGRTVNSGRMVRGADIMIGPLALKRDLYVLNMTGLESILGKPVLFDYNPSLDWMNNSMDLVQGGSMFSLNPNGDHHESKFGDARTTHAEMTEAVASGERCFATYVTLEVPQPEEDNHQQFTLELNNGSTCYVVVAPVLDVSDTGQLDASALEQLLTPTMSDTTQLSPESSTKIMNFIRKHPDVATESEAPSKPREVEGELVYHTITETPGSRPPFKQPYRMSSTEIK